MFKHINVKFLKDLSLSVFVCTQYVCVFVCVCTYPWRPEEVTILPDIELQVIVGFQAWMLEPNSSFPQKQYTILTTEPSFQDQC